MATELLLLCMQVVHLESSNASMAEDLLSKTAIIEHYVMETKSGIVSVHILRVVDVAIRSICCGFFAKSLRKSVVHRV